MFNIIFQSDHFNMWTHGFAIPFYMNSTFRKWIIIAELHYVMVL